MIDLARETDGGRTANRRGLTLVELLVVMAVVGILASISVPRLDGYRESAHLSQVQQDLRNVGVAQELHYRDHLRYADDAEALVFDGSEGVEVTVEEVSTGGWAATAVHDALEQDVGCAMYLGSVDPPSLPDGSPHDQGEGKIQCTG